MKRYFVKLLIGIMAITLLGLTIVIVARAGTQCYPNYDNCLTIAEYYHTVENGADPYWAAGVRSLTKNPTRVMDDIGYSYWTYRQKCYGIIVQQTTYGGTVSHYKSSFWQSVTPQKATCDDIARLGVAR